MATDNQAIGVSVQLLKSAVKLANEHNIKIIEAYPVIPATDKIPESLYMDWFI